MLTILGIGTGTEQTLTLQGYRMLQEADNIILQTEQIPLAQTLREQGIVFDTLDDCYEDSEDFDELQELVLEKLWGDEDKLLCILGDLYTNTLVRSILPDMPYRLVPGMGFAEAALSMCCAALGTSATLCSTAYDFAEAEYSGAGNLVITEVDSQYLAAEIALKLQRHLSGDSKVWVIHHGQASCCALNMLCMREAWDYSSAIVVPEESIDQREGYTFQDFCRVMDILLGENGCPWDKAQTHESLRIHLLEECYEVLEAIDKDDPFMLADELGDLLMQIVIHAKISAKHGEFDEMDVSTNIAKKMIRRHPRIFIGEDADISWDDLKRKEKAQKTAEQVLRDIPAAMSALMRAQKLHKKAEAIGFAGQQHHAWAKVEEELAELKAAKTPEEVREEAGDLLMAVVWLCHKLGAESELVLSEACEKFIVRFAAMEQEACKQGISLGDLGENGWLRLWRQAKITN